MFSKWSEAGLKDSQNCCESVFSLGFDYSLRHLSAGGPDGRFRLLVFIGRGSFPTRTFRDVVAKAQFRAGLEHFVGVNLCPPQLAESRHKRLNRKSGTSPDL